MQGGGGSEQGCYLLILGSGVYLSLGPAKVAVKKRNKMQQLSLQAFRFLLEFYCQKADTLNFCSNDSDILRIRSGKEVKYHSPN